MNTTKYIIEDYNIENIYQIFDIFKYFIITTVPIILPICTAITSLPLIIGRVIGCTIAGPVAGGILASKMTIAAASIPGAGLVSGTFWPIVQSFVMKTISLSNVSVILSIFLWCTGVMIKEMPDENSI